jgi:hypothetical protein
MFGTEQTHASGGRTLAGPERAGVSAGMGDFGATTGWNMGRREDGHQDELRGE